MRKPITLDEQAMYAIVRLGINNAVGTSFGFCFNTRFGEVQCLVTNAHVLKDASPSNPIVLYMHTESNGEINEDITEVEIHNGWITHPEVDLAIIPLLAINPIIQESGKSVYCQFFGVDSIIPQSDLETLSSVQEVTVYGYPNCNWNMRYNFPVFSRAITACHPAYDFNIKHWGVIDSKHYGGSSGSPVFIFNNVAYAETGKDTPTYKRQIIRKRQIS